MLNIHVTDQVADHALTLQQLLRLAAERALDVSQQPDLDEFSGGYHRGRAGALYQAADIISEAIGTMDDYYASYELIEGDTEQRAVA